MIADLQYAGLDGIDVDGDDVSQSQLAELGVLREHRRAFAVQYPLELRRPDAVVPFTQGATGVPPVAGLHRSTAPSPVAADHVRTSFSRRTLFSMYESNGFIGIAYYIRGISGT